VTWRKGESGNRGGRPKVRPWTDAIKRALARDAGSVDRALDVLADDLVKKAKGGDTYARDEIAVRLDGRAAQSLEVSGEVVHMPAQKYSDDELAAYLQAGGGEGASDSSEGPSEHPALRQLN
jgi:hypothetical protein